MTRLLSGRRARILSRGFLMVVLVVAAWRCLNFYSEYEPGFDSGLFQAIGLHVAEGGVLYVDAWDHKPPLVFALNAVAFAFDAPSLHTVRRMEQLFAVAGVLAMFAAVYLGFRRFWIAWLSSALFLFHFYWPFVFEGGNTTEEYGAVSFLAGVVAALLALESSGRRCLLLAGVSGAAFSIAVLAKEPFVLFVPPWFVYLVWVRGGDWRESAHRVCLFLLGAAIPVAVFLTYLMSHGAWSEWTDALTFNVGMAGSASYGDATLARTLGAANTKVFSTLLITLAAAALGFVSVAQRSFVVSTRGLPAVIVVSAALSLTAASLGGGYSGHYFLFFVPSYVLLAASGIALVAHNRALGRRARMAAAGALLVLLILDSSTLKDFAVRLGKPWSVWEGNALSVVVLELALEDDRIWAPWDPVIYAETRRLSPTKWVFATPHLFRDTPASTSSEKAARLRQDLQLRPPRVILLTSPPLGSRSSGTRFLERIGLMGWIDETYTRVLGGRTAEVEVLLLKRQPADNRPSSAGSD